MRKTISEVDIFHSSSGWLRERVVADVILILCDLLWLVFLCGMSLG